MCQALKELMKDEIMEERQDERRRVATDMLKENMPLSMIEKISKLPEETIRSFAKSLGIVLL